MWALCQIRHQTYNTIYKCWISELIYALICLQGPKHDPLSQEHWLTFAVINTQQQPTTWLQVISTAVQINSNTLATIWTARLLLSVTSHPTGAARTASGSVPLSRLLLLSVREHLCEHRIQTLFTLCFTLLFFSPDWKQEQDKKNVDINTTNFLFSFFF